MIDEGFLASLLFYMFVWLTMILVSCFSCIVLCNFWSFISSLGSSALMHVDIWVHYWMHTRCGTLQLCIKKTKEHKFTQIYVVWQFAYVHEQNPERLYSLLQSGEYYTIFTQFPNLL